MYDAEIGRTDYTHLVVWARVYPERPIPKGWTADHLCRVTLCQRPDHFERGDESREHAQTASERGDGL